MSNLKSKKITVGIIGASGKVGGKITDLLTGKFADERIQIVLFEREELCGSFVTINDRKFKYRALSDESIASLDFALMAGGGDVSMAWANKMAENGTVVIDNSSVFRMHDGVPLVVPEVNPEMLSGFFTRGKGIRGGIIANPNCSTIQAVVALGPLHKAYGLKRIVYSTYQAVSGAGMAGVAEYNRTKAGESPEYWSRPIYGNVIPQIDTMMESGNTKEEEKMIFETQKILGIEIPISSTSVRVPVLNGHSVSIHAEFEKNFDIAGAKEILNSAKGVKVIEPFPVPKDADGEDEVFIGRIRRSSAKANTLDMFVVADNIRKGAATNAIQILKLLIS